MDSCVKGRFTVHLPEQWQFRCIHVRGVRFRCIYLRDDDFGAFMCEGLNLGAFTWGATISVHSCVRGTDSGAFTWGVTILVHSCVRGKIPVHLLEGWWFRCIHALGVGPCRIYLRSDDFDRHSSGICTEILPLTHECTKIIIPQVNALDSYPSHMNASLIKPWHMNAPNEWFWFTWCIHMCGLGSQGIYLRDDDFGAFMCEG